MNRYNEIEKLPYSYRIDTSLHPSETHTIEFIGKLYADLPDEMIAELEVIGNKTEQIFFENVFP